MIHSRFINYLSTFLFIGAVSVLAQVPAAPLQSGALPASSQRPAVAPEDFNDHAGYIQLFDGRSLSDWDGDPLIWRVEDGAIIGESSNEKPNSNTYIWRKGITAHDFDIKLEIKCEAGGTGIQYRSQTGIPWRRPQRPGIPPFNLDWMMTGPQADLWFPVDTLHASHSGQFYSENTLFGIIAPRGDLVNMTSNTDRRLIGSLGSVEELGGYINDNNWNQYEVVARGGTMIHIINGRVVAILIDDDPASSNNKPGKIGFELERTPAKVSVRNIWLKKLN